MNINKVLICGNLTRDPELKAIPSGTHVATFGVATNRVYKDAKGMRQEQSDFHNIVVWGKQAENCAQYLKKGQTVFVEGRLQTRSWDKDGQKQYRTEIIADSVQFGPKAGAAGPSSGAPTGAIKGDEDAEPTRAPKGEIAYPTEEINPDDIPF